MPRGPVRSLYVELGTTDYECREENNNVILAATFSSSAMSGVVIYCHIASIYDE